MGLSDNAGFGRRLTDRLSSMLYHTKKHVKKTAPLKLYAVPIGSPESLVNKSISNYLSELCLSVRPIRVSHLSEAAGDPFSGDWKKGLSDDEDKTESAYFNCGGQFSVDIVELGWPGYKGL